MRRYKGTLFFGILFIIAGVVMLVIGCSNDAGKSMNFTAHTYTAENEVTSYVLDIGAGDVTAEFYDGDKAVVEYSDNSRYTVTLTEKNGTLTVKAKFKWYVFFGGRSVPKTTIKIPQNTVPDIKYELNAGKAVLGSGDYGKVVCDVSAGALTVGDINCNSLNCDLSAGSIKVAKVTCSAIDCDVSAGSLTISDAVCSKIDCDVSAGDAYLTKLDCPVANVDVSAGSVSLGFCDAQENYSIKVHKSAGKCNVGDRTANTGKSIIIDISAGSVTCNFSQAD